MVFFPLPSVACSSPTRNYRFFERSVFHRLLGGGGGHVAETGVWKMMESFYEREQRRTRNCVNLIYVTVGPANGTVRDMRTFFKVVVSEDIYWNEQ